MDKSLKCESLTWTDCVIRAISKYTGLLAPCSNVPHLRGHWLSGRLPFLREGKHGVMRNLLEAGRLAEFHASGVVTFWVEHKLVMVLTKAEDAHELKIRCHNWIHRTVPFVFNVCPGPSRLLCNTEAEGLRIRNIYKKVLFDSQALLRLQRPIGEFADKFIRERIDGVMNSKALFRDFVFKLAMHLFMGMQAEEALTFDTGPALRFLDSLISSPYVDSVYVLGFKDEPDDKDPAWKSSCNEMLREFHSLFVRPFEESILNSPGCLFYEIYQLKNAPGSEIQGIFGDLFLFVLGGLITTLADTFPLVVKQICVHSEVERKLKEELTKLKKDSDTDLSGLVYLECVVKETLRLNPPVAIIPMRSAATSFVFKGIKVHPGDAVLISPYLIHASQSHWHQPAHFVPERFLGEVPKGAYIPFGSGPRDCIGRHYAYTVLKMFIAKLFLTFQINLVETETKVKQRDLNLIGISLDEPINLIFGALRD